MVTLLLELFSEEIPSRMQRNAAEQLQRLIIAGLEKNQLTNSGVKTFVSPRHLAVEVKGLPAIQPDVREERKGPKVGAPEQAMKGFLGATGLTVEQCDQRDGYYYATIERKGRPTADVAKEIIEATLKDFSWPKSMRWGAHTLSWVRPLHRIVALLDDKIIPVQFAHLAASNVTEGHRFMSPGAIKISHAEQYEKQLNGAHVIVDYATRREQIKTQITKLATDAKLTVVNDEALLDEVTGLVEWPVPLLCQFDKKFLDLPREVLISEMKNHQRYFALNDASGQLSDQFITVANRETIDGGAQVKNGNARVVRARLADGEFYWEQDQKTNLEDWGKKLGHVVFHAKIGMMNEKVTRIEMLAVEIAKAIGFTDEKSVRRAAQLCKADLTSGMVGEFPELQGIMGRYYATAQGESQEIADAIRDHYKPLGANDSVPESELAAIIAVADKFDSITSLFAANEKPTGSKDPLALRRAALGILRILLEQKWELDLTALGATTEVQNFFRDRLENILRDEGIRHDIIEGASFTPEDGQFIPLLIANLARNLHSWIVTPDGVATTAAIKRTQNILAAEEKKDKAKYPTPHKQMVGYTSPDAAVLSDLLQKQNFSTFDQLAALTQPIQKFFDTVLVNDPHAQTRIQLLNLLAIVRETASKIADFSKIEG